MSRILIVAAQPATFADFAACLEKKDGVEVLRAVSGAEAMAIVAVKPVNTIVVDATLADGPGLTFVQKFTKVQPLTNCALVSSLSPEDFHEATEGLGVFLQLPSAPGAADAENMLQILKKIEVLLAS
jgi:DNA-binding NarL/FixJ family response regulator